MRHSKVHLHGRCACRATDATPGHIATAHRGQAASVSPAVSFFVPLPCAQQAAC
jgi:hypothetical protein